MTKICFQCMATIVLVALLVDYKQSYIAGLVIGLICGSLITAKAISDYLDIEDWEC